MIFCYIVGNILGGFMTHCPKCQHEGVVKNGHALGKQRWKCKKCNHQFTRTTPRGKPLEIKLMSVYLYCHGLSFNAIAKMFEVNTSTVLRWVRKFAQEHYQKPEPEGKAIIMELDEMWHYVKKNGLNSGYGKLLIAVPVSSLTGNVGIGILTH